MSRKVGQGLRPSWGGHSSSCSKWRAGPPSSWAYGKWGALRGPRGQSCPESPHRPAVTQQHQLHTAGGLALHTTCDLLQKAGNWLWPNRAQQPQGDGPGAGTSEKFCPPHPTQCGRLGGQQPRGHGAGGGGGHQGGAPGRWTVRAQDRGSGGWARAQQEHHRSLTTALRCL